MAIKRRRQNPESAMLQSEADDAIITSGAVMDEVYKEYTEYNNDLSVLAKIEAKLESQGKELNKEARARRRALKERLRQLDRLIAAYTSRVIKQAKSRLKEIKSSPVAKLHKRNIATVERDIFKLENMVKRKGSDVRLMANSLIGGLVTLEDSMGIKATMGSRVLSKKDRERENIRKLFLATYVRWDQVKKHARNHDKFFIRGSEVFSKKYGSGIVIDNDGRKMTVKFEGIPYKEMTKASLTPGPVMWVDAQIDAIKNKFKKGRAIEKSDIQRIVAKIVKIHNHTKPRGKLKTYKESNRALEALIGKIETRLSGDKMDKATVESFLLELEDFHNRVPARMKSEWAKSDQRQWAGDITKVRKALVKLKRKANPCIGFHFHGKDADELLKAVEASNARQRKGVKDNPGLPVVFHAKRGKEEIKVYEHTDTWRYSYDVYLNGKRTTKQTGVHLDGPVVKRRVNKLLDQAKEDGRAFKIVKNDLASWWDPKSNPTPKRARKYGDVAEEKKSQRNKERGYRFKREQRTAAKGRRQANPGASDRLKKLTNKQLFKLISGQADIWDKRRGQGIAVTDNERKLERILIKEGNARKAAERKRFGAVKYKKQIKSLTDRQLLKLSKKESAKAVTFGSLERQKIHTEELTRRLPKFVRDILNEDKPVVDNPARSILSLPPMPKRKMNPRKGMTIGKFAHWLGKPEAEVDTQKQKLEYLNQAAEWEDYGVVTPTELRDAQAIVRAQNPGKRKSNPDDIWSDEITRAQATALKAWGKQHPEADVEYLRALLKWHDQHYDSTPKHATMAASRIGYTLGRSGSGIPNWFPRLGATLHDHAKEERKSGLRDSGRSPNPKGRAKKKAPKKNVGIPGIMQGPFHMTKSQARSEWNENKEGWYFTTSTYGDLYGPYDSQAVAEKWARSVGSGGPSGPERIGNPSKKRVAKKNPPENCSPIYVAGERYEYSDPQQLGIYASKADAMREHGDSCVDEGRYGADHNYFVTRYHLKGSQYKATGVWLCKQGAHAFVYTDFRKSNPKGKTKKVPWSARDIKGMEEFVERKLGTKKKVAKKKATKKKATRKTKPEWQKLINRCRKLWDHYCERPSKARLKPVLEHLEKMKASTSKKVADERKSCLRIANKEARSLKMK